MTFIEKQTDPTAPTHWRGNMQADYFYSNGVAGDKLFKYIKNNDGFLATPCKKCNKVLFPPRMYCENCFEEIPEDQWIQVPATGTVRLFTIATINAHGEKMKEPKIMALINIDETDGALLGVINAKEWEKDYTDLKVKAIFKSKEEREGTLKDILYWNIIS
ncbi:MAG: hypothetical protein BAJALOKI1v1_1180008 [Promethearchaeota archaeon]|nr:MAG: hypothetical protein BAJALOKI1v1_1180008 [Candidatus Lokiarchaeota archaeon]